MKRKFKELIVLGVTLFLIIFTIVLAVIILKSKWAWVWVQAIIYGTSWLIYGIVRLLIKLNTVEISRKKTNSKDAIKIEEQSIKEDENTGDNIVVLEHMVENLGKDGHEKTPILIMKCHGTELNQLRYSIINLNDVKNPSRKINPSRKEYENAVRLMAEMPSDEAIKEEVSTFFQHGMPVTTTKRVLPSQSTEKEKEDLKKIGEETRL